MDASRKDSSWQRLEDLFQQAIELSPDERAKFIEESCGSDQTLRRDLESLLESDHKSGEFLAGVVQGAARDLVSSQDVSALRAGAQFGHYQILSRVGSGGMGQVYLAHDQHLRRNVALKTLIPTAAQDADTLRRFTREARAASALNHPNIYTIYEVGEFEGSNFIAAEFIDGETVRKLLNSGRIEVRRVVDIGVQMAAGLAAAHAAGIIHRDVKPENVMVRHDNLVKLVDFGIARFHEDNTSPSRSTRFGKTSPGMVLGTVRYMSPEQARGLPLDARSDQFSLGAVLYEMLSGRPAFDGKTDSDLIAEILKTDPAPLAQLAPGVPPQLARIVERAMRKDREQRYSSMSEMQQELEAFRMKTDSRWAHERGKGSSLLHAGALRWGILAASLVIGLAIIFGLWRKSGTSSTHQILHSLAVLPFRNQKPDPATDFLGGSLADAVTTKLGFINSLSVRPSSAVQRYRNQVIDPQKVGTDLDVDSLLTGSYLRDGDDLRVLTQLIDVRHNKLLWERSIDVTYDKLLSVQDRVTQQIIGGLQLQLTPGEARTVGFDNPINGAAYEDYLRGVDSYARSDFASAIQELERSAKKEPRYALTWARLGQAYTTNASLLFGGREQYRKAQDAYEKALELNPNLIEPTVYMANLFTDTGRVEQAVPLLMDALRTHETNAELHWELGYAYRFGGLLEDSAAESARARSIDPTVKITSSALNTYLYLGQYDKFLKTLPDSDTPYILFYRGFGEYYLGDLVHADQHFLRAYDLDPALLQAQVGKALSDAIEHKQRDGLRLLNTTAAQIEARGVADAEGIYKVSQAFAVLGDKKSALRLFEETIAHGFFPYPYFQSDPLLKTLRDQPEFEKLLAKAGDRHQRFKGRFGNHGR